MTMVGADTAELADLAGQFGDAAVELDDLARRLARSIDRTQAWQGPSADRCKDQWTGLAQTQMRQVADELAAAGRHLRVNAWAQDIASGDTHLFGILGRLYDFAVTGDAGRRAFSAFKRLGGLAAFFRALVLPATGFAALTRTERLIEAGRAFLLGTSTNPVLKLASRVALPLTVVSAIGDIRSGGGYQGWRAWATRGFALGGGAGAVVLIAGGIGAVATAPITATVAAVGVTAYALWSAGNYAYDHWDSVERAYQVSTGWVADRWRDAMSSYADRGRSMLATPAGGGR
ncbi:WXG100 family type VII secretion target [Nocardioides currus]|uniref:WXG100 family type VII secretion target n=1 Tax=Nocardioides currus TaxID=2133958 RepID=UPI001402FB5F|nr:WXG100 family type VII secretion target [Nocardioides currus]